MDADVRIYDEPYRVVIGIVEEEAVVPDCAVIVVKKGGETMQFCVPKEREE